MDFLVGILQICPLNLGFSVNRGLLTVRTLGLSSPRNALAVQLVPAEPIQLRRARRAPVLPVQIDKLQVA
eukprot:5946481-Alexandrium_andersonii.AAC.1